MTARIYILAAALFFCGCNGEFSMEQAAADLNNQLPAMVDSETRLDAITVSGDSLLSYHFTLVNASFIAADTASLRIALWPGLLAHVRMDPDMEKLRDDGVVIRYYYSDKEGRVLTSFRFTPEHYR